MTLKSIFLTCCVIALVWYWLKNRTYKDIALRHAAHQCSSLGLTFLDQSVVQKRLNLRRNERGTLTIIREYAFEFSSTGERRYQGSVVLAGSKVMNINLEAHKVD